METFILTLLTLTSIVSVTFIVERGWALRWRKVIPREVANAVDTSQRESDVPRLRRVCQQSPSTLSTLVLTAVDHLNWPKPENVDALQTKARYEITKLERGLVVLEIITGIAPLLGLVGTVYGMIALFADIGSAGLGDNTAFARGIAIALKATLMGLLIAIPSLVAWSYYNKKVETFAVEMENLCDGFLRRFYRLDLEEREPGAPESPAVKSDKRRPAKAAAPTVPQPSEQPSET